MSVLSKLASALDRNDEILNQELAKALANAEDGESIKELVANLNNPDKAVQSDCIKVLYEIGTLKPALIAPYGREFLALLSSRNNRLVWGAMTALGAIADLRASELTHHTPAIIKATETGSVITQDWGIRVLTSLAIHEPDVSDRILTFLKGFLQRCPSKDLPRHAASILPALNVTNREPILTLLESRLPSLKEAQSKRLARVIRQIKAL